MWVNGEKYIFSDHVVQGGLDLFSQILKLNELIKKIYKDCSDFSFEYTIVEKANAETPKNLKMLEDELVKFD